MNRLNDGFCCVRNPYYPQQVSKINLNSSDIDCIVFWTKNPTNLMSHLDEIDGRGYKYYFQFTITPYGFREIEPNTYEKDEAIKTFRQLSNRIGKDRVIWRYDPIFYIDDKIDISYHIKRFSNMVKQLKHYTNKCVISFLDVYDCIKDNIKKSNMKLFNDLEMVKIGKIFSVIAKDNNITLEACAENILSANLGIGKGKCIDHELKKKITDRNLKYKKDKGQRINCGCMSSVDIGTYASCKNFCAYCYAGGTRISNLFDHYKNSPFMSGNIKDGDVVKERKT